MPGSYRCAVASDDELAAAPCVQNQSRWHRLGRTPLGKCIALKTLCPCKLAPHLTALPSLSTSFHPAA